MICSSRLNTAPNHFAITAVNEEAKHLFVAPIDVVVKVLWVTIPCTLKER